MAHVEKRGQGKYRARWYEGARERNKTFARKVDAERFLATVRADQLRGTYVDPHDRTTVEEYAWRWASGRVHRPTSARRTASLIRTHIEGTTLGHRRLAAVLPSDVQAWASDRSKILAPSTLRLVVGTLKSIYGAAVRDRLVPSTPVVGLTLPPDDHDRVVPLTVFQVRELALAIPERNRAMVITQAGLGLRIGELLALRVEDIDFLARTARVQWQIAPGERTRSVPKTPRSRRTIPLPAVVANALAAHIQRFPAAPDGTLFTTRFDLPYRHDYYGSHIFKKAIVTASLPVDTTTHALRHHYASVLLAAGESVVVVADRLGHENATLVLKTYGHLMPDTEDKTRKAVDSAWIGGLDGLWTACDSAV